MKMANKGVKLFLSTIMLGGLAGCGAGGSSSGSGNSVNAKKPIVVGSLLDATGDMNVYGKPMIDATNLAISDINAHGGVLGRPLKLVAYDTQSDMSKYTQYATQLILKDKAAVIEGGIPSASREAIRAVADRYNEMYFQNIMYEGGVCDSLEFNTGAVPEQQLSVLIPWALQKFGKKVYIVAADYGFGHTSTSWADTYVKKSGGTVVGQEFIPLQVTDFSSTISKIQEAKPDVIISLLVGGNHMSFYNQMASAGLRSKFPIVSTTFGLGNEQIVLDPKAAQGIIVSFPYFQNLNNPANNAFVALWHKTYGNNYPYIPDAAEDVWNGWHLWAEAVNKAGSLDRSKVTKVLESGLTYDSPEGPITMDGSSHIVVHNIHIAEVDANHGFKILQTFNNVAPTWDDSVCNLVQNPNLHKQFTFTAK